ncbi:single-stranded DNA-binding protein [Anaerococcus sp. NML200574]|uniref:single-stranded DNA-binding protein n=1 Tax=Anaerococcus sp. NML200574 TaxID=2954486 RepID=UPI0022379E33|nr:single-stranded DNA-binding protein [Anaerococcus sp. NML200574]MCW6678694.1 single-stranded DNA-binding protein [Anaerococcus sp. NML200574]
MNKVILIGRLTRDPELRYTQSNQAVCTFNLAIDRRLSRERREEAEASNRQTADFPRITVWGRQGENASKYLSKGSQCAVEGRIQTGSYQDRETGKTVYTTDVVADNVEFLGSRNDGQRSANSGSFPGDNQDTYNNNYSQTNNYQNQNYNQQNQGSNSFGGNDDFFDDDFTEIQDDGRIPF